MNILESVIEFMKGHDVLAPTPEEIQIVFDFLDSIDAPYGALARTDCRNQFLSGTWDRFYWDYDLNIVGACNANFQDHDPVTSAEFLAMFANEEPDFNFESWEGIL